MPLMDRIKGQGDQQSLQLECSGVLSGLVSKDIPLNLCVYFEEYLGDTFMLNTWALTVIQDCRINPYRQRRGEPLINGAKTNCKIIN